MQNRLWSVSSLFLGVLTIQACAAPGPPPKELVEARLAIQDAKSANADQRATRTYDSATANLDVANKSWEKDHAASALLHQARLAEAEGRKAQYVAEIQAAEEAIRSETDRKTRNEIALRDAELVLLRKKGQEAELGRMKALAKEQEQALLATKDKLAAEQARADREASQLREEQDKLAALNAKREREEREAALLRTEQDKQAALSAERDRAAEETALLRAEQDKQAALTAERARTEQAEREVARLRAEQEKANADLTATLSRLAKVHEEARGTIVTLPGNIFFDVNKTEVKPAMQAQLTKIAQALAAVPDKHLLIEGHTDSDGASEYNLSLSELRAQSVKKILLAGGITEERVTIKGYGQTKPIADNRTAAGKAQNRRVEIVLESANQ